MFKPLYNQPLTISDPDDPWSYDWTVFIGRYGWLGHRSVLFFCMICKGIRFGWSWFLIGFTILIYCCVDVYFGGTSLANQEMMAYYDKSGR